MRKHLALSSLAMATGLTSTAQSVLAAEKAGMPQLDPANFAPQLVWLVIIFFALYLIMAKIALPKVSAVIDERQRRITGDLDEAERLKRETDKAISDYEKALSQARANAQSTSTVAHDQIMSKINAERAKAEAAANDKLKAAETAIITARKAALANVETVAADAARDIVKRVSGLDIADTAAAQAVASIRKEVG